MLDDSEIPLYTPCLNGTSFMGMVHVLGSGHAPPWGGTGHYVRLGDHQALITTLERRIEALQHALQFWLPRSPISDTEVFDHVTHDMLLLIGMIGDDEEPSAESLGWIQVMPRSKS